MADLIDRELLFKDLSESVVFTVRDAKNSLELRGARKIISRINAAPRVEDVKHGYWLRKTDDIVYYYACSVCGEMIPKSYWGADYFSNFCPHCGAKMDEEE